MVLAMTPAASWVVLVLAMAAPVAGIFVAWRRDHQRARRIARTPLADRYAPHR